jgi:hypothetical protein
LSRVCHLGDNRLCVDMIALPLTRGTSFDGANRAAKADQTITVIEECS